jgi:zinc protease
LARRQAIEAIRRQNDEPEQVATRAIMRAIYGEHPLGRTPTEQTVATVTRDDLLHFHQQFFFPNNVWLAVTGDFDRQRLMAVLERLFGDWQPGEFAAQVIPPVTPVPGPLILLAAKEIPQTTVLIGELGIDKSAPDLQAVRVMNYILGGGSFNSRLMREIRSNRGLAYSVYSYFQVGRRLPGPFIAGTETKSGSTMEAVRLIREIISEMQQQPVKEEELRLARESLINSFIFAFTDTHDTVTQQMRLDFYDYPEDYLRTLREKVAAVTAADVQRAAREHLDPARQKIVLVGNPAAFDGDPALLGPMKQVQKTGEFK